MKINDKMYFSEKVEKKRKKILTKLNHKKYPLKGYVLVLASNQDQLEFMDVKYLLQPFYKKNPPHVVGFAQDYEDALELVEQITKDVYALTNTADIKQFFLQNT